MDHFPNWKMIVHISITYMCYLPTWGVITSLSNKEVISTNPILSLKYTNFLSWTEALTKYFLSAHQWRYTREPLLSFGIYHGENSARYKCASTCHETTGSLRASHSSGYHNISRSNPTPDQNSQETNLQSLTTSVQASQVAICFASTVLSTTDLCFK
jgi:hypothetical protein